MCVLLYRTHDMSYVQLDLLVVNLLKTHELKPVNTETFHPFLHSLHLCDSSNIGSRDIILKTCTTELANKRGMVSAASCLPVIRLLTDDLGWNPGDNIIF